MKYILSVVLLIGVLFIFFQFKPQTKVIEDKLSTKDALGQMLIIGFDGTKMTDQLEDLIKDIRPGGVLLLSRNIEDAKQVRILTEDLQKLSIQETGVPLFIAVDQEGGLVSRVNWIEDTAQYNIKDVEHAKQIGQERAIGLINLGINMNLAPVLDSGNKDDFLYPRSFQKRDEESFILAQALIESHRAEGVLSVLKHFPGYDGIYVNPEKGSIPSVKNTPDTLLFEYVIDIIKPDILMLSHVIYEDLDTNPLPLSKKGIEFVREKLGDDVLLMSDDLLSEAFISEYGVSYILTKALDSGVDILLVAGYPNADVIKEAYDILLNKVEGNEVFKERVVNVAERIIEIKKKLR